MKKKAFFDKMEQLGVSLTYGDVRLKTGYSDVMPDAVNVESRFSRNVSLKIPLVSAAMDTVTEYRLAIELAKLGGIGVIHRNLNPVEQARQVAKVKRHLNGRIEDPVCVKEDALMGDILRMREEEGYSFHSFPVEDSSGKLVGLLTRNDFDMCDDLSLSAKHVMTTSVITAPLHTPMKEAYGIMRSSKKKVLPLVDETNQVKGMFVFSDLKRILSGSSHTFNVDDHGRLRVAAAIGVGRDAYERCRLLVQANVDVVTIDTAHGDSLKVLETIREIKKEYPKLDVVAGNISEPESVRNLIDAGADGIKVGQGPGSICTTRIIAGIGCPQVTAVYNCSRVADEYGVPICADGGMKYSGDITIAVGAGASCVMMGSMLAGTKESPGDVVFWNGRQWKNYRGMGSLGAMESNKGSRERYGQKETGKGGLIPEGVEGLVPYKGELQEVVFQYVGGLRRGMGYVGAASIEELKRKADFIRLSSGGVVESHPHGVNITKEAPNYQGRK